MSLSRFVAFRLTPFLLVLCLLVTVGSLLTAPKFVLADDGATSTRIYRDSEFHVVSADWPEVGIERVDEESRAMVQSLVALFEEEAESAQQDLKAMDPASARTMKWELNVSHEVIDASDRVVSILWNIWSFTGGAHGQLEMQSNNYDRTTGFPLLWEDLFIDPGLAMLQASREARKMLAEPDEEGGGPGIIDDMLREGTEPVEENYRIYTVTPTGISVHFPPYQVAPWAAGPQTVNVSLESLAPAKPNLEFWGKTE